MDEKEMDEYSKQVHRLHAQFADLLYNSPDFRGSVTVNFSKGRVVNVVIDRYSNG
jgi:hypothetical protein